MDEDKCWRSQENYSHFPRRKDDVGHFVPHFTVPGTPGKMLAGPWQVWTLGMTGFLQSVTASCTFTFMPNIADPGFIAMSDKAPLSSAANVTDCWQMFGIFWNILLRITRQF